MYSVVQYALFSLLVYSMSLSYIQYALLVIRFIVLLNLLYGHSFLAKINCYDFPLQRAGCHLVIANVSTRLEEKETSTGPKTLW
jgi:hypothetical protein